MNVTGKLASSLFAWILLFAQGCSAPVPVHEAKTESGEVPAIAFGRPQRKSINHAIIVPALVNGNIPATFVLDTGIGINLIARSFCVKIGCQERGHYSGKRMSGGHVSLPLSELRSLALGDFNLKNVSVGVLDNSHSSANFHGIDGFLSLSFFKDQPFTIDYPAQVIRIETPQSLEKRMAEGIQVPIRVERDGPSTDIFTEMDIGGHFLAEVEIDSGGNTLYLNEKFMNALGFSPTHMRKIKGRDDTDHAVTRYWAEIPGPIYPRGIPKVNQAHLKVVFQKMMYDGLVGDSFLKNFTVTFDLPHSRLIFQSPHP